MYVVELAFGDEPERQTARPAHRQKLRELHADGRLLTAGPFADGSGSLLIFAVADIAELDAVLADDPYYRAPGVTIVRKQEWTALVGHQP